MLWGCFASSGTGNLQCVKGKKDSLKYQENLRENIIQSARKDFQQDKIPGRFYSGHNSHLT